MLPIALVALLSGCTSNVTRLRELNPPASDFAHTLAAEYRDFAVSESEQGRSMAASRYAAKGLAALEGKVPEPDALRSDLPEPSREALSDARAQLVRLLNPSVKREAPQELARAQLLFDCWQQQVSEKLPPEKVLCGAGFPEALDAVIDVAGANAYDDEARHTFEFAPKVTTLNAAQQQEINDMMCQLADMKGEYWVEVHAYIGKKASQRRLTEKRIANVRAAIIKAGVPRARIRVQKDGSAKAVILSRDNFTVDTKIVTVTIQAESPASDEDKTL